MSEYKGTKVKLQPNTLMPKVEWSKDVFMPKVTAQSFPASGVSVSYDLKTALEKDMFYGNTGKADLMAYDADLEALVQAYKNKLISKKEFRTVFLEKFPAILNKFTKNDEHKAYKKSWKNYKKALKG